MRRTVVALALTIAFNNAMADSTGIVGGNPAMSIPMGVQNNICVDQYGSGYSTGSTVFAWDGKLLSCQAGTWKLAQPSELPAGTLCGYQTGTGSVPCNGTYPAYGCPAGWYLASWAEGNSGGLQYIYYCVKG